MTGAAGRASEAQLGQAPLSSRVWPVLGGGQLSTGGAQGSQESHEYRLLLGTRSYCVAQLPMLSTDLGLLDAGVTAVYFCLTWGVAFRFHP